MTRKIALAQQVEEVATTLGEREREYAIQIARRKLGPSLAQYRTDRLAAARNTLLWLQRHEETIRARCPELFGAAT